MIARSPIKMTLYGSSRHVHLVIRYPERDGEARHEVEADLCRDLCLGLTRTTILERHVLQAEGTGYQSRLLERGIKRKCSRLRPC